MLHADLLGADVELHAEHMVAVGQVVGVREEDQVRAADDQQEQAEAEAHRQKLL